LGMRNNNELGRGTFWGKHFSHPSTASNSNHKFVLNYVGTVDLICKQNKELTPAKMNQINKLLLDVKRIFCWASLNAKNAQFQQSLCKIAVKFHTLISLSPCLLLLEP
jgi:hypothetical protein